MKGSLWRPGPDLTGAPYLAPRWTLLTAVGRPSMSR